MKMPRIELPSGVKVATLGLGTWRLGENKRTAKAEIAALKLGLDLGMDLIDTAEMYGEGGAEELVGQAIAEFC
jgi:aryl-alcohol dehydrogenase-like predicted oxidoreductase